MFLINQLNQLSRNVINFKMIRKSNKTISIFSIVTNIKKKGTMQHDKNQICYRELNDRKNLELKPEMVFHDKLQN